MLFRSLINDLGREYESFKKVFRTGKLADAYAELNGFNDDKSNLLKAFVLILLKKTGKALEYLGKLDASKIDFIEKDIYFELMGFCYNEEHNKLEATKYYLKSLEINPNNFYSRYNLTNIYLENKNYKNAYQNLLILNEMDPEDKAIITNLEKVKKFI